MEVQISGCVFSSLFLELANSQGDIEGFLLGEISHRTTNSVSDSQDVSVKHQCIFAIHEIIVCQGLFSFYDGVGRIHVEKLARILGKKKQLVLGWFKFRRNSRLGISMRERAIHKNLLQQLDIQESEKFVFSVFTSQSVRNFSTHAFHYSTFYIQKHLSVFSGLPISIINLGNTAQTEYKQNIAATRSTSKQYKNVIGSFRDEFLDNVGQLQQVKHARSMYTNMLSKLKGLKEAVHSSESQMMRLSNNIENLKEQLEKAMQQKRLKPEDGISKVVKDQDLIILDEESESTDLMSFEDLDNESSQEPVKHVVVAKHIGTSSLQQETNSPESTSRANYGDTWAQFPNNLDDHDNQKAYNFRSSSPSY